MRILIVDDDEIALDVLERELVRGGHDVVRAESGEAALAQLRRESMRLVICDWQMPGMDGLEVCRRIRTARTPTYVYFILLTARNRHEDVVAALSAGADEFLTKPFEPAELCARIRAAERVLALESRDVTIFALAKLAESRDQETGEHLERVRTYCRLLAETLAAQPGLCDKIGPEFVGLVQLTSPLHDIGKVGIPDRILLKPGPLDADEFRVMKTHTTIGADTLGAASERFPGAAFLRMARDIALTHHERYNGSGYPNGLAERDIPLGGRIMAVADVYDALTSRRVYKQAISHEDARRMVVAERGGHFDPLVVDVFVEREGAFSEISQRAKPTPRFGAGRELVAGRVPTSVRSY